jgi:ABC-type maltose transport system permease subunit
MRYPILTCLTVTMIGFALLPIAVLWVASGLPDSLVRPNGIGLDALSEWRLPRLSKLMAPENEPLWASLARTIGISFTVAAAASSLAIISGYVQARWRSHMLRKWTRLLALAAYSLPSIFLLLAFQPLIGILPIRPLTQVWLLHFIYILPMSMILALGYAATYPHLYDRSAALDGATWMSRFILAYRLALWRGHLAIGCIGVLISWGDIIFSQQLLPATSKLIVDLYVLRYFDNDSTYPDYVGASVFSLIICLIALFLAIAIAISKRTAR